MNFNGLLGHNWEFSFNEQLVLPDLNATDLSVIRSSGSGRLDTYARNQDGSYTSPEGFFDSLRKLPNGNYQIIDASGFKTLFNSVGDLIAHQDPFGNRQTYHYDQENRLNKVIDTLGREIIFSYRAHSGRLTTVTDFTGRSVRYYYDNAGDLTHVRSPIVVNTPNGNNYTSGKYTSYLYSSGFDEVADERLKNANHNLLLVTDSKGKVYLNNTYENDPESYMFDRIIEQQFGDETQVFSWDYQALNEGVAYSSNLERNKTTQIDRAGNKAEYYHNGGGQLLREILFSNRNVNPANAASYVTTHTYNIDGKRLSTTKPSGDRIEFTYDSDNPNRRQQANLLEVRKVAVNRSAAQAQLVTTFNYEPIYNKLSSLTDAKGNTSTFTYDYQHTDNLSDLATQLGISTTKLNEWLSAANTVFIGGVSGQIGGNLVQVKKPQVTLANGASQISIVDYSYNEFGQKIQKVDPEGLVTNYEYYAAIDPDGDGSNTTSERTLDAGTGGYLKAVVTDAESHERRTRAAVPLAVRTSQTYDVIGNILSKTDGKQYTTYYTVNELNQRVRKISPAPLNYITDYFYDANNNLARIRQYNKGARGPNLGDYTDTVYGYNRLGDKMAQTHYPSQGVSLTTQYLYDANQNLTDIIEPEDNRVSRVYDERNLVYQVTQGVGSTKASTKTFNYDLNGNLANTIDAQDTNNDGNADTSYLVYDAYDRLVEYIDSEENRLLYHYDANSNRIRESRHGNSGITGQSQDIWLADITVEFDELNRAYKRADRIIENGIPTGGGDSGKVISTQLYDRNSQLVSVTDDNSKVTIKSYDGLNRLVLSQDANGNNTTTGYDNNHNVISVVQTEVSVENLVADKLTTTRFVYDALNRRFSSTDALNNTTSYRFDNRNNITSETDALANVTLYIHDGLNRLLEERRLLSPEGIGQGGLDVFNPVNSDGAISTFYSYDKNSRLKTLTDDNGNATTYSYDALNRQTSVLYADGTTTATTFDADNNVISATDQNGNILTHQYDALNRLVSSSAALAQGVEGATQWTYTYDGLSRRTELTDNNDPGIVGDNSTVQLRYNSLNQIVSETTHNRTVEAQYDGLGNRTELTYPSGRKLSYSYDDIYNIKTITELSSNGTPINKAIASFNYAGKGRILNRSYGNGTELSFVEHTDPADLNSPLTDQGYDALNRRLTIQHKTSAGALIAGFNYAYDKVHNRRFERDLFSQLADVYEYDSAYRLLRAAYHVPATNADLQQINNNDNTNADVATLTSSNEVTWLLDGVGNWVSKQNLTPSSSDAVGYQVNNMNEYDHIGPHAQTHDHNGNLTADSQRFYHFDVRNRLVRVTTLAGNTVAYYQYDGLNRRSRKSASSNVVQYHYFGAQILEERNALGQMQRQYVYGLGIDKVLQMKTPSNDYYYHSNSVGSVVAVSDKDGNVVERYRYDAYGNTTVLNGQGAEVASSSINNSYRYTGRRYDDETGFYYYRTRYYSPERGRFIQRDSIGYADGMGVYAYAGNNPINWVDPFGTEKSSAWGDLNAAIDSFFETFGEHLINNGHVSVSFKAGMGIAGNIDFIVTKNGVSMGGGIGIGIGASASITGGMTAGNSAEGFYAKHAASIGAGVAVSGNYKTTRGGPSGTGGVGTGLGVFVGSTFGYKGKISG